MLGPGWCVALLSTGLRLRVLASSPFPATLLSLGVACDAVGAQKAGDTEMEESREVSSLVTRDEAEVSVVKLVAAM